MKNNIAIEDILHILAERSNGTSQKLFDHFDLCKETYEMVFPLTKFQVRIYLDSLIQPNPHLYNVAVYLEHHGELKIDAWQEAIRTVAAREQMFNLIIMQKDSLLYQAVQKDKQHDVLYYDLRDQRLSWNEAEVFLREEVNKPYLLLGSALCRHLVFRVADEQYYMVVAAHQIIFDGVSGRLFFEQVSDVYHKIRQGEAAAYNNPHVFSNYVFFNHAHFNAEPTRAFWNRKLKSVQGLLKRNNRRQMASRTVTRHLTQKGACFETVKKYCRRNAITPALYFKGLFALLLDFYFSPDADFILFENYNGRSKAYRYTMGLLFYPTVVKVEKQLFQNGTSLLDYFAYFRNYQREVKDYRYYLSEETNNEKAMKGLRCFYNYISLSRADLLNNQSAMGVIESTSDEEIHLIIEERNDCFDFKLLFDEGNFQDEALLDRLMYLSEQITQVKTPPTVTSLDVLLSTEKTLLRSFTGATLAVPAKRTYVELFEEQAARRPDAIAVMYEGHVLTYRQLNELSNQLAHYLLTECQLPREALVGVLTERTHLTLVTMLAIFKAGGTYLPLDPEYTQERLQFILDHSQPVVVLTNGRCVSRLTSVKKHVLLLDEVLLTLKTSIENLALPVLAHHLAYLIYTSGSTGEPKGVMIEHGGMINHIEAKIHTLCLNTESTVAQNASQCFDISVWQFLTALLVGGKTVIYSKDLIHDVHGFTSRVHADGVSVLEVVPTYLSVMLDEVSRRGSKHLLESLDCVLITGETLNVTLVNRWQQLFPSVKVVNAYGPTEASDDVTHYLIDQVTGLSFVPIGKPLPNINIYVADEYLRLCPPGIRGEILVSGICVGRGYWNDEEQTTRSFREDPFAGQAGVRLYHTGDLGSWLPDGNLVFHGRKDAQVKIRGNRVEIGEVESVLLRFNYIQEAVVLPKEDKNGNLELLAYIAASRTVEPLELRKFLLELLPDYMVPSSFIQVDRMPVTINGKIDCQELLTREHVPSAKRYIAPRNSTEEKLLAIWSEVLGRQDIGVTDNLYEVGGHSLVTIQIIARIKEAFNVEIEISYFFLNPTIEGITSQIDAIKWLDNCQSDGVASQFPEIII